MAILGCNFNISFGQTLAPGSSLCNVLRTKLYAWTESSVIVELRSNSLGSTIYQCVLMALSNCPLEGWIISAQRAKNETPCNSKTKSQRSEPKWLLKYLITPNFCAKFQPNRLQPQLLAPGTLSQTMTLKVAQLQFLGGMPPKFEH